MSRSIYDEARTIGAFVASKIKRLQGGKTTSAPSGPNARAALARLRKLGTPGGGSWIMVGNDLFADWPELDLSERSEDRMLKAVAGALQLYALHQQAKAMSVAWFPKEGEEAEVSLPRCRSFGWSCRQIERDREREQGIRRRMAAIEATRDFDGMEVHLRALVQLMRGKDVRVDYRTLAEDLYLLQFESAREQVFMRWARDYYAPGEADGKSAIPAKDSE